MAQLAAGNRAPAFTLTDQHGKKVKLSDFKGRPVWINFWATWCPPCKEEMPQMQAVYQAHKDSDLVILGVDFKEDRALVRVDQVAALGSLSVRSLQRLFATYLGVSPKSVLARYRLQDAAAAIDAGQVTDLAGLAVSLGWFDQAHFSRDFRAVVGMPPSAYLNRARSGAS